MEVVSPTSAAETSHPAVPFRQTRHLRWSIGAAIAAALLCAGAIPSSGALGARIVAMRTRLGAPLPVVASSAQLQSLVGQLQMISLHDGVALLLGGTCNKARSNLGCGVLAFTRDAGVTWIDSSNRWSKAVKADWDSAASFEFSTLREGWLLTGSPRPTLLRTMDGGRTLQAVRAPGHPVGLSMASGAVWLIVGRGCEPARGSSPASSRGESLCKEALATTPATGPARWRVEAIPGDPLAAWPTPPGNYQPDAIVAQQRSATTGALFLGDGDGSSVAMTDDAGRTWQRTTLRRVCDELPTSDPLQLLLVTARDWVALCQGVRRSEVVEFLTSDAGVHWRRIVSCVAALENCRPEIYFNLYGELAAGGSGALVWAAVQTAPTRIEISLSRTAGATWRPSATLIARTPLAPDLVAVGGDAAVLTNGFVPIAFTQNGATWTVVPRSGARLAQHRS